MAQESAKTSSDILVLEGPQQALHEAIRVRDVQLADMYLGALSVLAGHKILERMPMAAHCIRELMEKLPRIVDVAIQQYSAETYNKWREMTEVWMAMCTESSCVKGDKWSGEIDPPLEATLGRLAVHFNWYRAMGTTRSEEMRDTLRRLDPTGAGLPPKIEKENLKKWADLRTYFQNVSHHKRTPTEDDFRQSLHDFESFLLSRLRPSGFTDQDELDRLIAGA